MANLAYGTKLQRRGKHQWYYFLFTVPKFSWSKVAKTKSGKPRKQIWISLGTVDRDEALMLMVPKLADLKQQFPAGVNDNTPVTYATIADTSRSLGFEYRPASEVRQLSVAETVDIIDRLIEARLRFDTPDPNQVIAMTGALPIPAISLEDAFDQFKKNDADRVLGKNERQTKSFWRRYELAVNDFTAFAGTVDVLNLDLNVVKNYRTNLISRVANGDFKSDYANAFLERILTITAPFYETRTEKNPFEVKKIKQTDDGKREAFTETEIKLLNGKMQNTKASAAIVALMKLARNTGAGVSELVKLVPEDIVLDGEIPHIKIRPNRLRNSLKTNERERDLPLIGAALEAARQFSQGFPMFQGQQGTHNANLAMNKFIKSVVPTKSFAGFRHRIAGLMRNHPDIKDQFESAVMGHANKHKIAGHYGGSVWLANMKLAIELALPKDTI